MFVRKPDHAREIADAPRNHGGTKAKTGTFSDAVEVLTGTMRGLERDVLVEKPVLKRFLDGNEKPGDNLGPVFLISTSAGEVGFDLNADHMVCDATTIDSMTQRLGRVNRRGLGDAQIHLFVGAPKNEKDGKPAKLSDLEQSIANTLTLLTDGMPLSPMEIAHHKSTDWGTIPDEEKKKDKPKSRYGLACTPEPTMVELTDILLDNWSMTSITGRMPGRPAVGPWLRGIVSNGELRRTSPTLRPVASVCANSSPDLKPATEKLKPSLTAPNPRVRGHFASTCNPTTINVSRSLATFHSAKNLNSAQENQKHSQFMFAKFAVRSIRSSTGSRNLIQTCFRIA